MRNKPRLLTPGPTPLPEEIRLALARDMIHHRKSQFKEIMAEVQEGLRELFGTSRPVLPLSASGSGAMHAAVTNLFAPGDEVLVVEGGKFGQRWSEIAERNGLSVVRLEVEWGQAVDPAAVAEELKKRSGLKGVLVQASETSTGVLHPVRELAKVTAGTDVLLVVDGISAVGISPCPMDDWGVDCLLTGSQKGLMLPPGLALLALSDKAWTRVEAVDPREWYFDLRAERDNVLKNQTHYTSPVNLIVGLRECLRLFRQTGLPEIYRKQWALTRLARAGAEAMGLELLAKDHFTWGLTSVLLPAGVDGQKLVQIAAEEHGALFAGGQDQFKGRIVRLGHMGWVDWSDVLAGLYALRSAFVRCGGYSACRDYLEVAMAAYEEALSKGHPME